MTAFSGEILATPIHTEGTQYGTGSFNLVALPGSGINPVPHYALACFDNVNVRHYWVDTNISLTNAPPGFTYVASTLVIEGKF